MRALAVKERFVKVTWSRRNPNRKAKAEMETQGAELLFPVCHQQQQLHFPIDGNLALTPKLSVYK